ncbi:MAG TPA: flavin reductase family protein [Limnochordia bacterium]|nr:flavin reductase family protein [Limnochordia bacterium]
MAFDSRAFRNALGQFATGVTVITVKGPEGLHGMTANAFTSVSLDPPLVLVCIDKRNRTHSLIQEVGKFGVSVLAEDHENVSRHFAGARELPIDVTFIEEGLGTPVIKESLAWLDCTVWRAYDGGDHTIIVGKVEALDAPGGKPLIFFQGAYRRLV